MKRLGLVSALVTFMLSAAGCGGSTSDASSQIPTAENMSEMTQHQQAKRAIPRWAENCLPKGSQRLGLAPEYIGLTFVAAQRLKSGHDGVVFAGGGGRCSHSNDLVYRQHPIAVVFNIRNPRDPKARIIAAVRATPGWQPGG